MMHVTQRVRGRPPEFADTVDDRRRIWTADGQVTALDDQVSAQAGTIGQDSLEGGQVAVDVGHDRDPHRRQL